MIEDGHDLERARRQLGWSTYKLARALKLCPMTASHFESAESYDPSVKKASDRLREMERGTRDISGPVRVAVEAFLDGFRPQGFDEHAGD